LNPRRSKHNSKHRDKQSTKLVGRGKAAAADTETGLLPEDQ